MANYTVNMQEQFFDELKFFSFFEKSEKEYGTGMIEPVDFRSKVYKNIRNTLVEARTKAYVAINSAMVNAYWDIGKQIDDKIGERAEYGKGLLQYLAKELTHEFGKGFTERNLRAMRQFYVAFPIRHTLCAELSWSHYRLLMKIENESRRDFYKRECVESGWSVRQLERQINSFFYERLLATQKSGRESCKVLCTLRQG